MQRFDTRIGRTNANFCIGNYGDDTLVGGAGADTFMGDEGNDVLISSANYLSHLNDLTIDGGYAFDRLGFQQNTGLIDLTQLIIIEQPLAYPQTAIKNIELIDLASDQVANTIRLNTDVVACMACNIYSSLTDLENSNVYEASLSSVFI